LIEAARELRLIDPEIEALPNVGQGVLKYRSPGAQVRHRLEIDEKTAELIFHILKVVISKR
jgi:hypothetical protein